MKGAILIGVITAAHGIRGEVKLKSFAATPEAIATYSPLVTASGRQLAIRKLRAQKDGFIAILDGVTDRNAAEALKGTELFISRERLPAPGDGEVYLDDLIGMPVRLMDGTVLGGVIGIENYGASDLLDVKVPDRKDTVLIPLAGDFVREIGEDGIRVDLPEGYLDAE